MNTRAAEALSGCAGPSKVCQFQALRRRQTCRKHSIMTQATSVNFAKYQGLGNDFILVGVHEWCSVCYVSLDASQPCEAMLKNIAMRK